MAEAVDTLVDRIFREHNRYADDGLSPAVTGALPIGDPQSGPWNPRKSHIREAFKAVLAAYFDQRGVETLADLEAITPETGTQPVGIVYADPDAANNGEYLWDGTEWVKQRGFPDTFARITLGGTANAQTGVVSAGVNPADIEVFIAFVTTPNTGALTLSVGGESARDVVNAAGNPLSAGEWTGVVLFVLNDDGDYQLIVDAGAAASAAQSASEAAERASEADGHAARAETAAASVVDRAYFASPAAVVADNNVEIGYTGSGANFEVSAGYRFQTADGFPYEVLADDAANAWQVETAGEVKLKPLSGLLGVSVAQFGEIGTADDSAVFQKWAAYLEAGLNKLGIVPSGAYVATGMALTNADVTILAYGTEIAPAAAEKVFDVSGGRFSLHGLKFDLVGYENTPAYGVYSDGAERLELIGVRMFGGHQGAFLLNSGSVHIERCFGDGAERWHYYIQGFTSCHLLYNEVINGLYDGLKVAGTESGVGGGEVDNDDLVVIGNICRNNGRDGFDLATNNAKRVIISDNAFSGNALCGIEYKIVYDSQTGLSQTVISGNIVDHQSTATSHGISVQNADGAVTDYIDGVHIIGNSVRAPDGVTISATGIRVAGKIRDAIVESNIVENFDAGMRVSGVAEATLLQKNKVKGARVPVLIDAAGLGDPIGTIVTQNSLKRRAADYGRCVELLNGSGTQIYENEFDDLGGQYTITDSGTGTVVGKNYRGWTTGRPMGRGFIGDTWRETDISSGAPAEWTCCSTTSSMGDTAVQGIGQRGIRTGGNPNGSIASKFRGEVYFQTSGGTAMWTSVSTGSTTWY